MVLAGVQPWCFLLVLASKVLASYLPAQPLFEDFVKLHVVEGTNTFDVYLENLMFFDVTVTLEMTLTNLAASDSLPLTTTLRGKERKKALALKIQDRKKDGAYRSRYFFIMGNRYADHDTSYVYQLPYRIGSSHEVAQGYFGKYSHDESSHYAVDFVMPEGTPVCAAREGVVVGLYKASNTGGPHDKYLQHLNYVFVRHSDATIGAYNHLHKDGVLVRIGEKVERGQVIAYSGSTGFSFAPHLHFEVYKAVDGKRTQSFPLKFATREGVVRVPIEGKAYIAR
ncbi:MAG: M23 family metallopeptidase [bacterium]